MKVDSITCYIQTLDNDSMFGFCHDAKIGAIDANHQVRYFSNSIDIPFNKYNVVVGSVEECSKWLQYNNITVPKSFDINNFVDFLGRRLYYNIPIKNINTFPVFIKPNSIIKEFNGFVANNKWDLSFEIYHQNLDTDLLVQSQEVIEIISEYRVYVNNNRIVGCKHYLGDCLTFPDKDIIQKCFALSLKYINSIAYTLDFGVLDSGQTVLIEINDGWALGNYGLDTSLYYQLIKNRWLQIIRENNNE
ncbi:MAG: ATP-grasp domain-containing protein [Bacteroidales bacterium]|jgi:hypothetical protein